MRRSAFGEAIGVAPGGVIAYSSHYNSADPEKYPSRNSYISFHNGIYTGYKYQCVEFARRWLVAAAGITFGDVHMAYHIFDVEHFVPVEEGSVRKAPAAAATTRPPSLLPAARDVNGGVHHRPVLGSLLLWHPEGYFEHTGHVAVVTAATDEFVRVAEQNVSDKKWPEGQDFARELPVKLGPKGEYTVVETHFPRTRVLGWVTPGQLLSLSSSAM